MKKLFAFLIPFLFLFAFSANALVLPHPIAGRISVEGSSADADVKVTNLGTGDYQITHTNQNGEYIVDLANFPNEYRNVDKIRVEVIKCYESNCGLELSLSGGSNVASFDLKSGQVTPVKTITTTITQYVCYNGEVKSTISECPSGKVEIQETTTIKYINTIIQNNSIVKETKYVCSNGEIKDVSNDCPKEVIKENTNENKLSDSLLIALITIAATILGFFGWGKGYVALAKYYKKKGDEAKNAGDPEAAKKYYIRSAKMLKTTLENVKNGKYK